MKFHAQDQEFFKEVSTELAPQYPGVRACHLKNWDPSLKNIDIVVGEGLEPVDVVSQVFKNKFGHFVQKNPAGLAPDLMRAGSLIEAPENYFRQGELVIANSPLDICTIEFSKPADKAELKDRALKFVGKINSNSVTEAADAVIEELYMNAILDGPSEAKRKGIKPNPGNSEIFMAYDTAYLQISCSDPYGSLEVDKVLYRMNEVYQKGAGEVINLGASGGAGLGCVILFENCSSLIIGVQHGIQTKVTGLIPIKISSRQRAQLKKSLHWLQI